MCSLLLDHYANQLVSLKHQLVTVLTAHNELKEIERKQKKTHTDPQSTTIIEFNKHRHNSVQQILKLLSCQLLQL